MAGKLPVSQKIKRSTFTSDAEFIAALIKAGRHKEAESFAIKKGLQ